MDFNRFYRYQELTEALHHLAQKHPEKMRIESLGKSYEGRDIWCAVVTDFETGEDRDKPALWVDGNIHASEVSASSACLHLLWKLLTVDDESVHYVLRTRTFYIVPRVNPDGAELALADKPVYLRSSVRPYPYDEESVSGLQIEDIDGDGRILQMRIEDPNGPWKVYEKEPRLLVRREPEDRDGPFYRLLPEGRLLQPKGSPAYDGVTLEVAPLKQRLDLNRNYPANWRPEAEQKGAGPFPASEPEVRACVAFLTDHPNICHAVAFHTFSGVVLRPYSHSADEKFPVEDLDLFKRIGKKCTELSGYPCLSVFHDFRYHAKEVITGTFDDWAYEHLGLFAWTCEIWSAHRQAGITNGFDGKSEKGKHRFIDWFDNHPIEEEVTLLKWSDEELGGAGYQDWQAYEHPELGELEIGGWDRIATFRNPPLHLLEKELEPLTEWLLWQAQTTPLLAVHSRQVDKLSADTYRLQVVIQNQGYLPTYVTKKALERKTCRPPQVELVLEDEMTLVSGDLRQECEHLEGVAYKPTSPILSAGDPTDDRVKLVWVVQAPRGGMCSVVVSQERGGKVRVDFDL